MLDKFEWPKIEDEGDEVVVRNVRKHGCHIVSITDGEPPYEFSIGLFLNYDQAELIMFGLEANDSVGVINSVRDRAAAGRKYLAGEICDDLLIESKICFIDASFPAFVDYNCISRKIVFWNGEMVRKGDGGGRARTQKAGHARERNNAIFTCAALLMWHNN